MPKIKQVTVYAFGELSEKAQDRAIDWFANGYPDYDWWDSTYEDAKNIGLTIGEFDLGRAQYVEASFDTGAIDTARACMKEHGKDCETYKDSERFALEYAAKQAEIDSQDDEDARYDLEYEFEAWLEDRGAEYLHEMSENYRIMLDREYEYLTSREHIVEMIEINEYEFDESGRIA